MKVMLLGSIPGHVGGINQPATVLHEPMFKACAQLGAAVAARGDVPIVGSDSPNTADYYFMRGFLGHARTHSTQPRLAVEVHRPDDGKIPYAADEDAVDVTRHFHPQGTESSDKWFMAHVLALDAANAVVTIGGGNSTRIAGKIAAGRGVPVLAVRTFGGTSRELYDHLSTLYHHQYGLRAAMDSSLENWRDSSAETVVNLLHKMADPAARTAHAYFISYSRKDLWAADHVETLLRRANRVVNRDEASINLGDGLNQAIKGLVAASDTYVAMRSKSFDESKWCSDEYEFARARKEGGQKPRRIIDIFIDDDCPPDFGDDLAARASLREQRQLAIRQAMDQEDRE